MSRQGVGSENRRENRRHRRLLLEAEVAIRSEGGLVSGRTLDVSESGMAAVLPVELRVGETVGLEIKLPTGGATGRATVRSRNVGRHGFEFVQPLREAVVHQAAPDDCQNCRCHRLHPASLRRKAGSGIRSRQMPRMWRDGTQEER